ncbi:MAG TPA: transcriptional initiation protein Tat [Rhodopila sp.]
MSIREERVLSSEHRLDGGSGRRGTLVTMGLGLAASVVGLATTPSGAAHAAEGSLLPAGATSLRELTVRLSKAPRPRDFKTVPMILDDPGQWDHAALSEVIAYRGGPRQVWNNTEIAGPWLNGMRNSLNSQIWSFRHRDFLTVSATHGTAHLALFDAAMWDKYQLGKLTGGKFGSNTLAEAHVDATADANNYEDADGPFSAHDNSIPTLQRRGVVFLACHNAILEIAGKLIVTNSNPDKLSQAALGAELTNHLIAGVVLTPGIAGTLVELQQAGFTYAA